MISAQCACGFTELPDEEIIDHLERVFIPDDGIGQDGHVHEERATGTCLCGFAADGPAGLDAHLLAVFTPDDAVGLDGKRHVVVSAA